MAIKSSLTFKGDGFLQMTIPSLSLSLRKQYNMQLKTPCKRTKHCWMLHVASVCTPCCMLLRVVARSLKPVRLFSQQLPTFLLFRDRRSVGQQCWIRLHSSSLFPTLLGPRMLITHGFQRLMGCIYPTMHCRSQTCWELLHPLHTTANTHATTPNIVGAIMLVVVPPVCTQPKQRRRRGQRDRHKSSSFRLAKQLCTCITLFCTFLSRHCTTTP